MFGELVNFIYAAGSSDNAFFKDGKVGVFHTTASTLELNSRYLMDYALDSNGIADTLRQQLITTSSVALPTAGVFLTDDIAIGAYSGTQRGVHINLATATITSETINVSTARGLTQPIQIMAADTANSRAVWCAQASNIFNRCTSGATFSTVVPGVAEQFNCVIWIPGGTSFLFGTHSGTVREIDWSGSLIKTITIPNTPNSGGSVPVPRVNSLAYNPSNDQLFVATAQGMIHRYTYATSTLEETYVFSYGAGNSPRCGAAFSNIANGTMLVGTTGSTALAPGTMLQLWDVETYPYGPLDEVHLSEQSPSIFNLYLDASLGLAYVNMSTAVLVGRVDGLSTQSVKTRTLQAGSDVASRIYRLQDPGLYRAKVESDQSVLAGVNDLNNRFKSGKYLELSAYGAPERIDGRDFTA